MTPEKEAILAQIRNTQVADIQNFALTNPLKLSAKMLTWAAMQLQFRAKLTDKVPTWAEYKNVISPPKVSVEQASSEQTAVFKANLLDGKTCLDLTMGMGIDTYFFAQKFEHVTGIEQNSELAEINRYNFKKLGVANVEILTQNAEDFLGESDATFDVIYLDPARRNDNAQRVFLIEDCSPNVVELLPILQVKTRYLLIKYAPMLDIKAALAALKNVAKVYVLAVNNDVKEVLYVIDFKQDTRNIETINFYKDEVQQFSFSFSEEESTQAEFAAPQRFLYEPNSAIMKAGAFKTIAKRFGLKKLAINTHLYTSELPVMDFPGRSFEIDKVDKFDKKILSKSLKNRYVNVSCRNFPLKPEQLKKMLGYRDGGDAYLFFTQNQSNEKIVLFTKKIGTQITTSSAP